MHAGSPIPASSFYAPVSTPTHSSISPPAPPPPPKPSKASNELLREKFLTGLRPLLKPEALTGGGAVGQLATFIATYGIADVETETRLEILSKIRDNAPNHYFRAWAENATTMAITKTWLNESGSADKPDTQATMAILHVSHEFAMRG